MSDLLNTELSVDFLESLATLQDDGFEIVQELPPTFKVGTDARSLARVLKLVEDYERLARGVGHVRWFSDESEYPIWKVPKHAAFFAAGLEYPERLFMAANRVGKSVAGAFETSCHLTGLYPIWWCGHRFNHPIEAWAVGKDARSVRDTAQKELIGNPGEEGTGMIPAGCLGKAWGLQGTNQAIDMIMIKHVTGGWSRLGFKNYKQDIGAFMGTSKHVVWLDEECPLEIYNECNIRTATTGGIMLVTFTPLDGLTPMVVNFCKKADFLYGARPPIHVATDLEDREDGYDANDAEYLVGNAKRKAVVQAGWDDAPWLDEETKARLLEDTPIYMRDARSKGTPSIGAGNVYPFPVEQLLCDPFTIPDNWPRMYALDVGWNMTAALWATLDPNSDTLYLYDEHYQGKQTPQHHAFAIKSRGDWIRGVIDPAARGRGQADGMRLIKTYKYLGLHLAPAKNELESGIQLGITKMSAGKLKVFKTLYNWQGEYLTYTRKNNGAIDDHQPDHLMDVTRYIMNNMSRMSSKSQQSNNIGARYDPPRYNI